MAADSGKNEDVVIGETSAVEDEQLRVLDKDLEFGLHILSRESARTEQLKLEQEGIQSDLRKVEREIHLRGVASTRLETWVAKLTEQVQMMAAGSGMGTTPIPLRNPSVRAVGRNQVIYISNCPVCGFNFQCHNISVADCGCCYHHFCLAAWLSDGRRRCASYACGLEFCQDWLNSFGANQVRLPPLRVPKMEGHASRSNRHDAGHVSHAASTNFNVESASGTPTSMKQKSVLTPSSGHVKARVSGSWKTPSSSVGRVPIEGPGVRSGGVAYRTPAAVSKSGSPPRAVVGGANTFDESLLFAETEEVCFTQARKASHATPEGGADKAVTTLIPETVFLDSSEGVPEVQEIQPPWTGKMPKDTTMSEEIQRATSSSSDGGPEHKIVPTTDFLGLDKDMVQSDSQAVPPEAPATKKSSSQGAGSMRTSRKAALRNTMCPAPASQAGTQSEDVGVAGAKKVVSGRGRATQGVARVEKVSNMKPLALIGVQEKFWAPAVVADAGKGRGRGGKHAKRKRDGSTS
ncbi:hypothetical protein M758_4G204100 [Ceratodon purpureus]|nr:hypothetical protein M758_4G204100 [Ceratodon purpureus]